MRIIEKGVAEYKATCSECGCRFAYVRTDVHTNYARGGEYVSCPDCGEQYRHLGVVGGRGTAYCGGCA